MKILVLKSGTVSVSYKNPYVALPEVGNYRIRIDVISGKLKISHRCFVHEERAWMDYMGGDRKGTYILSEGETAILEFDIQISFGEKDQVYFFNKKMFKDTVFRFEQL